MPASAFNNRVCDAPISRCDVGVAPSASGGRRIKKAGGVRLDYWHVRENERKEEGFKYAARNRQITECLILTPKGYALLKHSKR